MLQEETQDVEEKQLEGTIVFPLMGVGRPGLWCIFTALMH